MIELPLVALARFQGQFNQGGPLALSLAAAPSRTEMTVEAASDGLSAELYS
jgi:hypothetical protein